MFRTYKAFIFKNKEYQLRDYTHNDVMSSGARKRKVHSPTRRSDVYARTLYASVQMKICFYGHLLKVREKVYLLSNINHLASVYT
jgi:hypothetical protein